MSEVTMCARQEDASRAPKQKKQKRPLSIIEEYDSDDGQGVPEYLRNGDPNNGSSKENTPLTEDPDEMPSPKPAKDDQSNAKSSNLPVTQNISSPITVSKSKNVTKTTPGSPKTRPDLAFKGSKGRPSSPKSSGSPTPSSPSGESKIPVFKSRGGRRSALTPTGNDNQVSSDKGTRSDGVNNSTPNRFTASSHSSGAVTQEQRPESTETSSRSGADTARDKSHINILGYHAGDGHGLARIRETAERLNLTSPSSSLSPTSPTPFGSLTPSPKFGHRLRGQTSTARSYLDGKTLPGTNVPQITVTSMGDGSPHFQTPHTSQDSEDISNNNSATLTTSTTNNNNNSSSSSSGNSMVHTSGQAYNNSGGLFPSESYSTTTLSPSLTHRSPYHYSKSPKLSRFFNRRLSTESTGSLSDNELSDGSSTVLESPEDTPSNYVSDFWRLKETAEKLRLSTRRPSTMLWRQQYMESAGFPRIRPNLNGDASDERLTSDRKQRIDEALEWLRNELQEMRSQDQNLARQLLTIRQDIHQLKLRRSTEEHQELIDDFQSELEELQEFSDVLDLPQPVYGDNPLKHIGVTRLNISARRFSAC